MKKLLNKKKSTKISPDTIADMADKGKNVTKFFDHSTARVRKPGSNIIIMQKAQRVNVDFAKSMLNEIDTVSSEINISRQSLIKTWLRECLDRYYATRKLRQSTK